MYPSGRVPTAARAMAMATKGVIARAARAMVNALKRVLTTAARVMVMAKRARARVARGMATATRVLAE
jgi:hypothetical protein